MGVSGLEGGKFRKVKPIRENVQELAGCGSIGAGWELRILPTSPVKHQSEMAAENPQNDIPQRENSVYISRPNRRNAFGIRWLK